MKTQIVTWTVRLLICLMASALQLAGQPQLSDTTLQVQIKDDSSAAAQDTGKQNEITRLDEVSSKNDSTQPALLPVTAPETLATPDRRSPNSVRHDETYPAALNGPIRSISIESAYLYYKEIDLLSGKISTYIEQLGTVPSIIRGEPKSIEHGYLQGFTYAVTHRLGARGTYFRPSVTPLLSLYTTYDGSTQGDTILDAFGNVVGIDFEPLTGHKVNIFLTGSGITGYQKPDVQTSFGLYSGLRMRLWYRSMNNIDDSKDDDVFSAETYFWASIPLGLNIHRRVGEQWRLGADLSMDCMIIGFMKNLFSINKVDAQFDYPSVTLGNKAGYRLEFSAEKKISPRRVLRIAPYFAVYGFDKSESEMASVEYEGSRTDIGKFYEPKSGSILSGLSFTIDLGAGW